MQSGIFQPSAGAERRCVCKETAVSVQSKCKSEAKYTTVYEDTAPVWFLFSGYSVYKCHLWCPLPFTPLELCQQQTPLSPDTPSWLTAQFICRFVFLPLQVWQGAEGPGRFQTPAWVTSHACQPFSQSSPCLISQGA